VRDATVVERDFDDGRTVQLTLETRAARQVSSPVSGILTKVACHPADKLISGQLVASVDGRPVIGLATSVPLWRDLEKGDTGDDVLGLQRELARLGYAVRADGILGTETIGAVARLIRPAETHGDPPLTNVPFTAFAWLPAAVNPAQSCPALTGGTIEAGGPLAVLPVTLTRAFIATRPRDLVPGARTLSVSGLDVEVTDELEVSDPASLDVLAASPGFTSATSDEEQRSLPGELALSRALRVDVVPPAAVYEIHGQSGCVAADGRAVSVTVVGSELGETFVEPRNGQKISRVSLGTGRPKCR
jgi:peptidoglycan hydrolase-like protein with peptidoglycan-binding domain